MDKPKNTPPEEKSKLHPRSKHRQRYDFEKLVASSPDLKPYLITSPKNDLTIDFSDPEAVRLLNMALLKYHYGIKFWNIPREYLCPPVPGRADYLHYAADLLGNKNFAKVPTGPQIKCLDIGVGANCVYPLIGIQEYGWSFTGIDVDPVALEVGKKLIEYNPQLKNKLKLRYQHKPEHIFYGAIQPGEIFDLTICNPPFHGSLEEAKEGNRRKNKRLKTETSSESTFNFGGQSRELWTEGGERKFVQKMIHQSTKYPTACFWYTTLLSKKSNLNYIHRILKSTQALDVQTIPMQQGNKTSRMIAWTFLGKKQQKRWIDSRWKKQQ